MLKKEDYIKIWRHDTPPPHDEAHKYDKLVTYSRGDITIHGFIAWDDIKKFYTFQLVQKLSDTEFRKKTAVLSDENYLFVRHAVRENFGVYVTRGIYDQQCPQPKPITLETLHKMSHVTVL
jgi:hypothetical protein